MAIETISKRVSALKRYYNENDAESLCKGMGICVLNVFMGKSEKACKGFFVIKSRIPVIVLNNDMSPQIRRIVLAHELGHAVLHAKLTELRAFGTTQ